ncbi:MAG: hypothetical protein ACRDF7_08425, partial [Candidatus Limnocylindrales bacterium]
MSASVGRSLASAFAAQARSASVPRGRRPARRAAASPQPSRPRQPDGFARSRLVAIGATLVVAWIVIIFGRAVADSAATGARAEVVRRDTAAAAVQLLAERVELALIQTPAYIRLEARAYGYGQPGERAFALEPGGPAAPLIT